MAKADEQVMATKPTIMVATAVPVTTASTSARSTRESRSPGGTP